MSTHGLERLKCMNEYIEIGCILLYMLNIWYRFSYIEFMNVLQPYL